MALFDRKKPADDDAQTTLDVAVVESQTESAGSGEGADATPERPARSLDRPARSKAKALPAPSSSGPPDTRIGESVQLEGKLKVRGGALIDGIVKGRIESEDLLEVGPDADLAAEVHAGALILHGSIEGNVTARERVVIHSDGELRGDLRTPALQVDSGALFFGHCDMGGEE